MVDSSTRWHAGAGVFSIFGELVLLAGDTFHSIFTHKLRWKLFLNQVVEIGLLSQLVVVITGGVYWRGVRSSNLLSINKELEWGRPLAQ